MMKEILNEIGGYNYTDDSEELLMEIMKLTKKINRKTPLTGADIKVFNLLKQAKENLEKVNKLI